MVGIQRVESKPINWFLNFFFFFLNTGVDFLGGTVGRVCLPVQETLVQSLVWEDSMPQNHIQLLNLCSRTYMLQLHKPSLSKSVLCNEKPPQWEAPTAREESSPHSLKLEKRPHSNKDPSLYTWIELCIHIQRRWYKYLSCFAGAKLRGSWESSGWREAESCQEETDGPGPRQ